MVNMFSGTKCTFISSSSTTYSRYLCHTGRAHSRAVTQFELDQGWPNTDVMGELHQQKITLNWGQRAEWKPQVISFIHIKLRKVAKCAKLIRLIRFFSLSGSQRVLIPHLDMILTRAG